MSVALSAVPNASAQPADPVAVATALAEDFSLTAADHDKSGEFAAGNFEALFKSGLLGLVTAEKDGGWGEGMETTHAVITAIAKGDPSTALILAMHYSVHAAIRRGSGRRHWPQGCWPPMAGNWHSSTTRRQSRVSVRRPMAACRKQRGELRAMSGSSTAARAS